MASEDVVGKSRGDTAVNTIVNLAEEAKLAREGVKGPGHQVLTVCKSLFAGGVAGGLSRTAVAPLERLKILLQVQNPHSIKYNGTVQGLKYIWRTEGLRGLFKGNGTNCARIVPNSAVKFFSYEQASRGVLYLYRQQTGDGSSTLYLGSNIICRPWPGKGIGPWASCLTNINDATFGPRTKPSSVTAAARRLPAHRRRRWRRPPEADLRPSPHKPVNHSAVSSSPDGSKHVQVSTQPQPSFDSLENGRASSDKR